MNMKTDYVYVLELKN